MTPTEELLARYRAGQELLFGRSARLRDGQLEIAGTQIPLNVIQSLSLDERGDIVVRQSGARDASLSASVSNAGDADALLRVVNQLLAEMPLSEKRTVSGWPRGTIGAISGEIGYDVRELYISGYSDQQIWRVRQGELTLDDLFQQRPEGRGRARGRRRRRPARRPRKGEEPTPTSDLSRGAVYARWTGRVLSVLAIAFILLIFLGEAVLGQSIPFTWQELIMLLFFPIGLMVGLVVAWWREALGAGITLGSLAAFYLVEWLATGDLARGPFFALLASPAIFYALAYLCSQRSSAQIDPDQGPSG